MFEFIFIVIYTNTAQIFYVTVTLTRIVLSLI